MSEMPEELITDVSIEQIVQSSEKDKVYKLAEAILGRAPENDQEVLDVFNLELRTFPSAFSVSRGEKRPPQSYLMNDYHLSFSFNLYSAWLYVLRTSLKDPDPVSAYRRLKGILYQTVTKKMMTHEAKMAELINEFKQRDGLV